MILATITTRRQTRRKVAFAIVMGRASERANKSWNRWSVVTSKPHPTGACGWPLQGKWFHGHAWGVRCEHLKVIDVAGHNQAAASR